MIKVTSFYKFFPIKQSALDGIKKDLMDKGLKLNVRGLILLAEEGINTTVSGAPQSLEQYKKELESLLKQEFFFKDSECEDWNFKMLSIKIKKEIINVGAQYPHLKEQNNHLSPSQWESKMKEGAQVLDVRNDYEVEVGKFKQAKDLNIENFKEFPNKIDESNLDKQKDTLIYCTGGIRCEKAIEIMKDKGFKKVYQLNGGIINYLKDYPNSQFQDECFVFDHRVCVDQNLQTSKKYKLCPHCGQPGYTVINCVHCQKKAFVCDKCLDKSKNYKTCSKNCSYHFKHGHKCKKIENLRA